MAISADEGGRRLQDLIGGQRGRVRAATALEVLAALLWVPQAALVAGLFADLLTAPTTAAPGRAAALVLVLAVLRAGLGSRAEALLFDAGEAVVAACRQAILDREAVAAAPSAGDGPGAVAALAREKLDALVPYVARYAPAQARVAVLPPLILAIASWHSWAVGVVLLAAGPLIPVFMALVGWAAREASQRQMAQIGTLGDLLVDRLSALPDIQILNAGQAVTNRFADAAEALRARTMAVLRVAFLSSTVLELFSALGVAMVAVWVGFSLLGVLQWGAWGGPIDVRAGMFLLLLAPDFFQPLRDLAAAWHDRAAAQAAAAELAAWEAQTPPMILGRGIPAARLPGPAAIAWQRLTAARGGQVIRYPDARIAPGARVAITGPSGSGKTTLLRLLAGLERPHAGRIMVADRKLDDSTADGWRAKLGWMPQAPLFLSRSLRHNIAFGAPLDAGVTARAVLGDVIATLPRGELTMLGETGAGLSGGEARRVMLARAMHGQPDVILADEPTADLDRVTAHRVTDALLSMAERGCTVIVATHDARLIARMDRVISPEAAS